MPNSLVRSAGDSLARIKSSALDPRSRETKLAISHGLLVVRSPGDHPKQNEQHPHCVLIGDWWLESSKTPVTVVRCCIATVWVPTSPRIIWRCIMPVWIATRPRGSAGAWALWLLHSDFAFPLGFRNSRLWLFRSTFDFSEWRALLLLRLRWRLGRHLVTNNRIVIDNRCGWRLIRRQPRIGNVLRLHKRVEIGGEQTEHRQIRREGNTGRRTRSVYTITAHRARTSRSPTQMNSLGGR